MRTETIKYFADCNGELVEIMRGQLCPRCNQRHQTRRIIYSANPSKHACNAKCMNATGPLCECSCGGKNHGAGFVLSGSLFAA